MNQVPSMLEYILAQQGRQNPSEEEMALLAASRGEQPMQMAANESGSKGSLLQRLFGRSPPPAPQPPVEGRKVDELVAPGSLGDQLRQRRLEQERMLKEQAGLQPEDMLMAQAPDPYGGVSARTRGAMDQLGKDVGGDMSDLVVGGGAKPVAGGNAPAQQSVRGKQTPRQEEQLIKMLIDRGMDPKEARMRAKSVI